MTRNPYKQCLHSIRRGRADGEVCFACGDLIPYPKGPMGQVSELRPRERTERVSRAPQTPKAQR